MKKLWLLAVLITPLQLIHAQEVKHAPTVEQCRADQKLWLANMEGAGIADVSYKELIGRFNEMGDCMRVDPEHSNAYFNTQFLIAGTQGQRLVNFLHRHNLWDRFLAEDAQGEGR